MSDSPKNPNSKFQEYLFRLEEFYKYANTPEQLENNTVEFATSNSQLKFRFDRQRNKFYVDFKYDNTMVRTVTFSTINEFLFFCNIVNTPETVILIKAIHTMNLRLKEKTEEKSK